MEELLVGRYRLKEKLGGGGMGEVYEARDERIGRTVAVKLLKDELSTDDEHVKRFVREARAAGALNHPHIVQILDVSQPASTQHFIVMERLPGRPLSALMHAEGRFEPERVVRLALQTLSALGAAHDVGIVHRDIKPGNILVVDGYDGGEVVKLIDFGIAKLLGRAETNRLTATGQILGTPSFMAPEQLSGEVLDRRVDLYAVGALMYTLLSGRRPFEGSSIQEMVMKALIGDYPPLDSVIEVDYALSLIVARALENERDERFASAEDMSRALEAWQRGEELDQGVAPAPVAYEGTPKAEPAPAADHSDEAATIRDEVPPAFEKRRPWAVPLATVSAMLIVGIVGFIAWTATRDATPRPPDVLEVPIPLEPVPVGGEPDLPRGVSVDALPPEIVDAGRTDGSELHIADTQRPATP